MLLTIAVLLMVLWMLGLITGYTMGGVIHLMLAVAIVIVLFNISERRRIL